MLLWGGKKKEKKMSKTLHSIKLSPEIISFVEQQIPKECILKLSKGKLCDYITYQYLIPRLNEITHSWDWEILDVKYHLKEELSHSSVVIHGRLTVRFLLEDGSIHEIKRDGIAVGAGAVKSPGDWMDLSVKTADTDAFKRACRSLGWSLGLQLYGKLDPDNIGRIGVLEDEELQEQPNKTDNPGKAKKQRPKEMPYKAPEPQKQAVQLSPEQLEALRNKFQKK